MNKPKPKRVTLIINDKTSMDTVYDRDCPEAPVGPWKRFTFEDQGKRYTVRARAVGDKTQVHLGDALKAMGIKPVDPETGAPIDPDLMPGTPLDWDQLAGKK